MAFLCPVRIRRGNKKKASGAGDVAADVSLGGALGGMGRITGSASIETLVRVGIEKEHGLGPDSKMVVLHDFAPCVDDELEVKRGQVVNVLYRENDWVYVIVAESRREGFIPHSYCAPAAPPAPAQPPAPGTDHAQAQPGDLKKKLPRGRSPPLEHSHLSVSDCATDLSPESVCGGGGGGGGGCEGGGGGEGDACPFSKDPSGRYVVLYGFAARDENDVAVERGEFVTVLNREDPDWYWVVRSDGQEGFIPSGFVYPAVVPAGEAASAPAPAQAPRPAPAPAPAGDARYHGTELVMLYDYKAQAPDDLSARRGEWLWADLAQQTVEGWLWAHAPKSRRSGFIPTAYARAPHTTAL